MERDSRSENLLEFVLRFRRSADRFIVGGEVTERRAMQILYQKFPKDLQIAMQLQPFQRMTLEEMERLVRHKVDWISFMTPGSMNPQELSDYMEIDTVKQAASAVEAPKESAVSAGLVHNQGRVDFGSIKTIADFREAIRVLGYRSDIQTVCREVSQGGPGRRPPVRRDNQWPRNNFSRDSRAWQPERSSAPRVFEVDEAITRKEDSFLPIQAMPEGSQPRPEAQDHPVDIMTAEEDEHCVFHNQIEGGAAPLMHCDIQLNDRRISAMIDTGAAISLIPWQTCVKFGFPVDTSRTIWIKGITENKSQTKGTTCLEVQVGHTCFQHTFHAVNFGSKHKVIMGNDLLKKHGFVPDPAKEELRISDTAVVPCHVAIKREGSEISAQLQVKRVLPQSKLPTLGTEGSIGHDLYSAVNVSIPPGGRKLVSTGLKIQLPSGCYGRIAGRSGIALKDCIDVAAGVIDPDYQGDIGVILCNHGSREFNVTAGMRIAQLVCEVCTVPSVQENRHLYEEGSNSRGDQGFGSTGLHQVQTRSDAFVITQEAKARFPPTRNAQVIQIPCNRSFYLRPKEEVFLYLPFKATKPVVLLPSIHQAYRVETGLIQPHQYFRLKITNLLDSMMHVTEKSMLCCFVAAESEQWTVQHGQQSTVLPVSFFG